MPGTAPGIGPGDLSRLNENAYSGEEIVRTSKNHQTGSLLAIRIDLLKTRAVPSVLVSD